MSPRAHARANENKLEKVNPNFSSSVGDFGRLFLSETICLKIWSKSLPKMQKCHFQLTYVAQKRRCLSSLFYFSVGITNIIRSQDKDGRKTVQFNLHEEVTGPFFGFPSKVMMLKKVPMTMKEIQQTTRKSKLPTCPTCQPPSFTVGFNSIKNFVSSMQKTVK